MDSTFATAIGPILTTALEFLEEIKRRPTDWDVAQIRNAQLRIEKSLDKAQPIIIVTHRYHLPRANASFRWAGFETVTNAAADNVSGFLISEPLLWESVKWPLNVLRAAAASAAMAGDVPRENYVKYLE